MTPLLYNAKQQGVIQKSVVTIALIREGIQSPDLPGGTITYGDVDTKHCGPNVMYLDPLDHDPSVLSLYGVSFGGFEAPRPDEEAWVADFGLDYTVMGSLTEVTDALARLAGAENGDGGIYFIQCNATVLSLFLTLNGQRFEIPGSELIRLSDASDPSTCIFNVFGVDVLPGLWSVGAALARKYCLVFEYGNVQLGFSENLFSALCSGRSL